MKKAALLFIKIISILVGVVLLFLIVTIIPVDRTPISERPSYGRMNALLAALDTFETARPAHRLQMGYSVVSMVPPFETAIAGTGLRKTRYTTIHDSLFVRTMVITNGTVRVALVALDMLIVPPQLTARLTEQLPSVGFDIDHVYLSATHTHSSIGNWAEHPGGTLYAGSYNQSLIDFLSNQIINSIERAESTLLAVDLRLGTVVVPDLLFNRVADEAGGVDSLLHIVEFHRSDSSKAILTSFTGHATCMPGRSTELSRDYPGVLVDQLEANGYDFAMFMAGAVGSHGCRRLGSGVANVDSVGRYIGSRALDRISALRPSHDSLLSMIRIPLFLDDPQFKISQDWRVRPSVFRFAMGEYPVHLTALRLGDQLMLGTPCDFSGELTAPLYHAAGEAGMEAMVTSFNGGYIGYITKDEYYDRNHYETRLMNWYGPGNGAYLTQSLVGLMHVVTGK